MKIPWVNYEDAQKINFKQKNVFTFSAAPDFHHINEEGITKTPWINYEDMQKINVKQKNVFTFSVFPDSHHIKEESTENNDDIYESDAKPCSFETVEKNDLGVTFKRKKRSKLRKKCKHYRKTTENRADIYKSDTKPGSVDTVQKNDLDGTFKRKKRSKLRKKCTLSRKNTENRDDICESDTKPGSVDTVQINDLGVTFTWKKRSKLRKKCTLSRKSTEYRDDICESDTKPGSVDTAPINDLGVTFTWKKRSKLRKKCTLPRKSTEYRDDICESHTKPGSVDTVPINDLGVTFIWKKRSKLRKKCTLSRTSIENRDDICESHTKPGSVDTVPMNDFGVTFIWKKRSKLRKKCTLSRKSIENRDDICESDTKPGSVDTVPINDLGVTFIWKKRSKLRKKYTLSRKSILFEKYSIGNDHTDGTHDEHDDDYETHHDYGLNKHAGLRPKTIKIPFSTFAKTHKSPHPPIFGSTISATALEHNLQIDDVSERVTAPHPDHDDQTETVLGREVVSRSEYNLQVDDVSKRDAPEDNLVDGIKNNLETENVNKKSYANDHHRYTGVRSRAIKIPISTFAEIDNFLHPPIFGSTTQNTFKFKVPYNKQIPQLDTKIFDTITYYHEQPYCHLVGFKSHEIIFLTDPDHAYRPKSKVDTDNNRSVVVPIHDSLSMKNNTCHSHAVRVPVIVGEYNIEICLEEDVLFEEKIYKVKEISKEVVLTNCKFVPADFSHSTVDGVSKALRGKLFIEGYIYQNIEYIVVQNENEKSMPKELETFFHPLHQKIVLDLIVQLLQVQKVTMGQKEI
ncbi:BC_2427 family protein [Paenisporosarcina sp. NPDC076898]|uniref:BC_2427 family protein n=1 Tax=unclassified Paenisporosarcina TaxID=2642018 RepID=UPI003D01D1BB